MRATVFHICTDSLRICSGILLNILNIGYSYLVRAGGTGIFDDPTREARSLIVVLITVVKQELFSFLNVSDALEIDERTPSTVRCKVCVRSIRMVDVLST